MGKKTNVKKTLTWWLLGTDVVAPGQQTRGKVQIVFLPAHTVVGPILVHGSVHCKSGATLLGRGGAEAAPARRGDGEEFTAQMEEALRRSLLERRHAPLYPPRNRGAQIGCRCVKEGASSPSHNHDVQIGHHMKEKPPLPPRRRPGSHWRHPVLPVVVQVALAPPLLPQGPGCRQPPPGLSAKPRRRCAAGCGAMRRRAAFEKSQVALSWVLMEPALAESWAIN